MAAVCGCYSAWMVSKHASCSSCSGRGRRANPDWSCSHSGNHRRPALRTALRYRPRARHGEARSGSRNGRRFRRPMCGVGGDHRFVQFSPGGMPTTVAADRGPDDPGELGDFMVGIFGTKISPPRIISMLDSTKFTPWRQRDPEPRHARIGDRQRAAPPRQALEEGHDRTARADDVTVADHREARPSAPARLFAATKSCRRRASRRRKD